MTPDEIVALWREHREVHAFARAVEAIAKAEGREECAKVCDGIRYSGYVPPEGDAAARYREAAKNYDKAASECAAAIRARGQDPMPLFDDWPGGWKE